MKDQNKTRQQLLSELAELRQKRAPLTDLEASRRQMEEALRECEDRYRLLFEGSPVILLEQDFSAVKAHLERLREAGVRDFRSYFENNPEAIPQCAALMRVIDVNQAALEWYQVKNKEALRVSVSQMLSPAAHSSFGEELVAIAEGKAHFELESMRGNRAGGYTHIVIKWAVAPGYEDTWAKVLVSIFDVTGRKREEEILRTSEARYRAVVEDMPALICRFLPDGTLTFVNDHYCRYFNRKRPELEGLDFFQFIPEQDRQAVQEHYASLTVACPAVTCEHQAIAPDGAIRWQRWIDRALFNEHGEPVEYQSIGEDITESRRVGAEREAMIQELEAKNAELERFTYTASHDLKSPLITIKGFLGFLEQDLLVGNFERMRADLGRIANAADKMGQLLDELLELSRIGRLVNPPERIPFAELAREAVSMIAGRLAKRGVQVDIAPDLPVVYGDRHRLREVLENLVDNAAKFMGEQPDPRVEIGVRREGEQAVFYVRDNGVGIDPCYHDKVFGLFEKLDTMSEGSGIGLALVKRIVEVHGGRTWVESEGPGRGSLFCFSLPESRVSTNTQE